MRFRAGYLINQVQRCCTCHFQTVITTNERFTRSNENFCAKSQWFSRLIDANSCFSASKRFQPRSIRVLISCYKVMWNHPDKLHKKKNKRERKTSLTPKIPRRSLLKMQTTPPTCRQSETPPKIIPWYVSHRNHVSPGASVINYCPYWIGERRATRSERGFPLSRININ